VSVICHLVPANHWHRHAPTAAYLPRGFASDGFIHGTWGLDLLLQVANTSYFPHIRGPLNRDAMVTARSMPRHDDGHSELPTDIDEPSRR